jgi:hypothetical protein
MILLLPTEQTNVYHRRSLVSVSNHQALSDYGVFRYWMAAFTINCFSADDFLGNGKSR